MIGFAAETENLAVHAAEKRAKKGCDWILANDVSNGAVFGGDKWPELSKNEIGGRLALRIAEALKGTAP